jgi:hypothetical protein
VVRAAGENMVEVEREETVLLQVVDRVVLLQLSVQNIIQVDIILAVRNGGRPAFVSEVRIRDFALRASRF